MVCAEKIESTYKREPVIITFIPCRICHIGAHSDRQLGKIAGLAMDQGIHMAYRPKRSGIVEVCSVNFPTRAQWHIHDVPENSLSNQMARYIHKVQLKTKWYHRKQRPEVRQSIFGPDL